MFIKQFLWFSIANSAHTDVGCPSRWIGYHLESWISGYLDIWISGYKRRGISPKFGSTHFQFVILDMGMFGGKKNPCTKSLSGIRSSRIPFNYNCISGRHWICLQFFAAFRSLGASGSRRRRPSSAFATTGAR
jgi:hypothetical protein